MGGGLPVGMLRGDLLLMAALCRLTWMGLPRAWWVTLMGCPGQLRPGRVALCGSVGHAEASKEPFMGTVLPVGSRAMAGDTFCAGHSPLWCTCSASALGVHLLGGWKGRGKGQTQTGSAGGCGPSCWRCGSTASSRGPSPVCTSPAVECVPTSCRCSQLPHQVGALLPPGRESPSTPKRQPGFRTRALLLRPWPS